MPKETLDLIIPGEGGWNIIPNDGVDLEQKTRGIVVGTAGNLRVRMADGSDVVWPNMAAGIIHPLQIIRVFATGTTATIIRGLR